MVRVEPPVALISHSSSPAGSTRSKRKCSVIASVGHVSAHAPQDTHDESLESRVEAGCDVRVEAAPGRGQRERALDLVAGANAAPAGDAELVLEDQVGVARVVLLGLVGAPRPAGRADARACARPRRARCAARGGRAARRARARPRSSRSAAPARRRSTIRIPARHGGRARRQRRRGALDRRPGRRGRRRRAVTRSSKQSVATSPPAWRTASSAVVPGSTSTARRRRRPPSSASTPARRASARSGFGSAPACRRRERRGSRPRASRAAPRASAGRPPGRLEPSPARGGARSGRESTCRSSRWRRSGAGAGRARACRCARRRRRSRRGRPCSPRPPARRSRSGVSSVEPGRIPPSGPPIWSALISCPSTSPPPWRLADLAHRRRRSGPRSRPDRETARSGRPASSPASRPGSAPCRRRRPVRRRRARCTASRRC